MPREGKQDVQAAAARVPVMTGFDTEAWDLPGAEILTLSFEVAEEPAEWLLPPALHPSIPPFAIFSITRFPHSPVGPFALAQVRLVARAGARPRAYLLGAHTDSEQAAAALQSRWGFAVEIGSCAIDARHDRIVGRVQRGAQTRLEMELRNSEEISGADVTYPDSLHLVRLSERGTEKPVLIQVDPEYVFHHAQRGRPHLVSFQADAWGGENRLCCTYPIAATYTRCDTDLPRLRFGLDPSVPNARGRMRFAQQTHEQ